MGDLGISIKMEEDKDMEGKKYVLKGVTKGFVSEEIMEAFRKGTKVSKRQLLEADKYAVKMTF